MKRTGSKYQQGDRFIMKMTYNDYFREGDIVEITSNNGKKKRRTQVTVKNDRNINNFATFSVIYLGKRIKK